MGAHTRAATSAVPRRRRQDQVPREKTSLSLRADLLEAAKALVSSGKADNLSAFVERAVEEKVRQCKRVALYAAYETAAKDDDFRESMSEVARDFATSLSDGL